MKKLISIILTACICLSLLGGISFAGAVDTATWGTLSYTYDFIPGQGDNKITAGTRLYDIVDFTKSPFYFFGADPILTELIDTYNKNKPEAGGGLSEDITITDSETEPSYSISVNETYKSVMSFHASHGLRFKLTGYTNSSFLNNRWVALKLDTSKIVKGTYDIIFDSTTTSNLRKSEIYLAPVDPLKQNASEYITKDNLIFKVTQNTGSKMIENFNIASTEYVLVIKFTASDDFRLKSITFKYKPTCSVEHSKEKEIVYNLTTKAFKEGIFTSAGLNAANTSGSYFDKFNWNTTYAGEQFMESSQSNPPWGIDWTSLSSLRSSTRITDTMLRVDFINADKPMGSTKTYYENDFTGEVGTTRPYFVIRTYVPNDGTFNISISGSTNKDGGKVDVYLKKADLDFYSVEDIATLRGSAICIGTYNSATNGKYTSNVQVIELERGEYVYLFVPNEESKDIGTSAEGARCLLSSITLTPTDDAGYTEAFKESDSVDTTYAPNVVAYAYAKDNTDIGVTASAKDDDADGIWTLEAPEYAGNNNEYKFLYWAKGLTTSDNRLVVSTSATYNEYVPQNNNNFVIAVYDKDGETPKAEFYNANGQLIETLETDGNAPALPYMPGYGQASNWALHGTSTKISGGDPVTLSGNMIFFAEYDTATPDTFEITVNGKTSSYNYGALVTCKANTTDADGNIFYGWRKTVNGGEAQLVTADANYTFYAWEDCVVTPVYKKTTGIIFDGAKRKILLGTFDLGGEEAVMAEFIGFEDADEKGIILGTQEIAMTSDNNQFTVVNNNEETSISGYAILSGTKYIFNK